MTTREAEKVYTTAEAAERKSVSQKTITRAIHQKDASKSLAAKKFGSGYRIKASDLDDWYDRLESA